MQKKVFIRGPCIFFTDRVGQKKCLRAFGPDIKTYVRGCVQAGERVGVCKNSDKTFDITRKFAI